MLSSAIVLSHHDVGRLSPPGGGTLTLAARHWYFKLREMMGCLSPDFWVRRVKTGGLRKSG